MSVIVPLLNEGDIIAEMLASMGPLQGDYPELEWLFVDGGSRDNGPELLRKNAQRVIASDAGRARQMNAGAAQARGQWLLFLHIDTHLNRAALAALLNMCRSGRPAWGRFDVHLDGRPAMLKVVATMMNWRSRLTGIATGDMGIFMHRSYFDAVSGFPDQALMEDIEISRRLRSRAWPKCLAQTISTSGRRWESRGVWATIFLMWRLRLAYFLGRSPAQLARRYYR